MEATSTTSPAVYFDRVEIHIRLLKQALRDRESSVLLCGRCRILFNIGFSRSEVRRIMTRFMKQRIRKLVYQGDFSELHATVEHALRMGFPEAVLLRAVEHSVAKTFGNSIVPAQNAAEYLQ